MKNAYTVTKNGVVRSSTRAYSKRELERFAAQEEHQKAITHDFFKPDPFYRRAPHELHSYWYHFDEYMNVVDHYSPEPIKPRRTPYGRVLDSKKARRGYKKPKDLYFDTTTCTFYEIGKHNTSYDKDGNPTGEWLHVFVLASGVYNCRFDKWANSKGYPTPTLYISDGICTRVEFDDHEENPLETEYRFLYETGILAPNTVLFA